MLAQVKKCKPRLYIVKVYKNIDETRISSQHFFKSAGYKLTISIISALTVECMLLHILQFYLEYSRRIDNIFFTF